MPGLKLTSLRYERLHTFGSFENEKFSAEAQIEDCPDIQAAGDALRNYVDDQIRRSDADRERRWQQDACGAIGIDEVEIPTSVEEGTDADDRP